MEKAFRQLNISNSTFSSSNENEYDIIHHVDDDTEEDEEDDDTDKDKEEDDDEFDIIGVYQNANECNYHAEASIWKGECLYFSNIKIGNWSFHKDKPDYIVTIPTHGDGRRWYLHSKKSPCLKITYQTLLFM